MTHYPPMENDRHDTFHVMAPHKTAEIGMALRFGMLCDDPLARPIIDALSRQTSGHQLVCAVRMTEQADSLLHGVPQLRFLDHWEDLLASREIDAVIVGGSDSRILEGARHLAAANIPILFIPNADQGSTFIYELSLVHDDNHVTLWPLFYHRHDAAVLRLKQMIASGAFGHIQYLQLQRGNPQSQSGTPIPKPLIDREFLGDVDLPRWLMGDYDQITCLQTAATDQGVQVQSVVLAGRSLPEVNWSMNAAEADDDWRLTVRAERGTAVLRRRNNSPCWVCEIGTEVVEGNEDQTACAALTAFASSLPTSGSVSVNSSVSRSNQIWGELVKAFETVDATHRSIRRRRTIELHFEPMSERAIFKTQMTAIGCGLLVATFFLTLAYLGLASLVPLPSWVLILLRTLVFTPLVLFLFAQILLPLTRPSSNETSTSN